MRIIVFLILLSAFACNSLKPPTVQFNQYEYSKSVRLEDDKLVIELENPLQCPLRIWIFDESKNLQPAFDSINPLVLNIKSDTLLVFTGIKNYENKLRFSSRLGDPDKPVEKIQVDLPFLKGRTYRVIQGNNSSYTHNTDYSRYAVDFDLKINDTISAATDGYVVGVIDQYKYGGPGEEWRSYGNFVTVYEPRSGIFTQYAHLVENGSLVNVGDRVKRGQPIALSGKTGQTDIEHLHFNTLVPVNSEMGLKSIPVEFIEGYKSLSLKKGDIVRK